MAIDARRMTYSVEDAAAILGVSKSKIYDSVRNGELRGVQVGRRVVVPCDVLEKLVGALSIGEPREPRERAPGGDAGTELNAVYVTGRIAREPALRASRTGMASLRRRSFTDSNAGTSDGRRVSTLRMCQPDFVSIGPRTVPAVALKTASMPPLICSPSSIVSIFCSLNSS